MSYRIGNNLRNNNMKKYISTGQINDNCANYEYIELRKDIFIFYENSMTGGLFM